MIYALYKWFLLRENNLVCALCSHYARAIRLETLQSRVGAGCLQCATDAKTKQHILIQEATRALSTSNTRSVKRMRPRYMWPALTNQSNQPEKKHDYARG